MTEPEEIPFLWKEFTIGGRRRAFRLYDPEAVRHYCSHPTPKILKELQDFINDYLRGQNINHTFRLRPDP
jgi:hypothetical protein